MFRLWPVSELPGTDQPGPHVYLVTSKPGDVIYVGQTTTTLRGRFRGHLRDPQKAAAFTFVASMRFDDDVSLRELNELERRASTIMQPSMGAAWPRSAV
ncbi:GIY-YIG nuclease family protein [Nocardia rhamnosiphila]